MFGKAKKFFIPSATLIVSFYFSVLFVIGIIIGYLGTKSFYNRFVASGRIGPIFLNFGKWRIHLHHWIMGVLIIIAIALAGWLAVLPKFCLGMVCGLSLHDFYFDKEWHKIVFKRN